ncbi:MAG: ABC transporter ATP-binding protein [Endomicrobiales bacterium]|nr:ABC transporter ATP-binding protein [Endomicrobiales bacterium]
MYAIEVRNLTKTYVKKHLTKTFRNRGVEELTFGVNRGEIFGLLGLNGSGKTTTIKLLLGLLKATSGEIKILDEAAPSTGLLKKIGYLPEVPYFYRYLTGEEILKFYARLSDIKNEDSKVQEVLSSTGLSSVSKRRLSEFSKGMLQRIGLAQSLLHDPEILIYDEPVSGLDPLAISQMRELIVGLKKKGKTVFLSSHLISEVEKICDRVGILASGRLVRVIEQKDWNKAGGGLEKIFVSDVAGTAELGAMKV